ncbi:MAG: TIGR04086 family membrane protein [bacterium]|nr:TIGR04086 family membrane protein [bacterium]
MKLKCVCLGTVISFVITFAAVFLIAAAEYSTGMTEGAAGVCAYISAIVGVFLGSLFSAGKSGTKALVNAMPIPLIYIAVIIAASLILNGRINTDIHCLSLMTGVILAGFLGAVCGQRR